MKERNILIVAFNYAGLFIVGISVGVLDVVIVMLGFHYLNMSWGGSGVYSVNFGSYRYYNENPAWSIAKTPFVLILFGIVVWTVLWIVGEGKYLLKQRQLSQSLMFYIGVAVGVIVALIIGVDAILDGVYAILDHLIPKHAFFHKIIPDDFSYKSN